MDTQGWMRKGRVKGEKRDLMKYLAQEGEVVRIAHGGMVKKKCDVGCWCC